MQKHEGVCARALVCACVCVCVCVCVEAPLSLKLACVRRNTHYGLPWQQEYSLSKVNQQQKTQLELEHCNKTTT